MKITKNIAKILILISELPTHKRYAKIIAGKLDKDYNYITRVLSRLEAKLWIRAEKIRTKKFYSIGVLCPIEKIKLDYAHTRGELLNETQTKIRD